MDLKERLEATLGSSYSVEREIGGGGMSRVFLAHETALGRNVVVKVLSGETVADISAERFAREVKLAASLQHPHIVPVLATGVADGIPWYTMPYVKGESLRARMRELGKVPIRPAISILRDVARALQYAHAEGVVHRDIKPENVLLSGDAAVVTDFGIAKAISVARTDSNNPGHAPTLTRAGSTIGTPSYMAPEQVAGDTIDRRTDLYAWGMLAYEMLSGGHPFSDRTNLAQLLAAQLTAVPPDLAVVVPELPSPFAELVMRCLEKDPDQRPASAEHVLEALDLITVSRDQPTINSPRATVAAPQVRKGRRSVVIGLALVVVAGIAGYGLVKRRAASQLPSPMSSVAVLPFADDRADSTEAYFGEGIAD